MEEVYVTLQERNGDREFNSSSSNGFCRVLLWEIVKPTNVRI